MEKDKWCVGGGKKSIFVKIDKQTEDLYGLFAKKSLTRRQKNVIIFDAGDTKCPRLNDDFMQCHIA
ncbi:MAG: hypothetical protein IKK21_05345 [Clostridia bacterium]|nr:hypothetical protein [Clostridia bacterium]